MRAVLERDYVAESARSRGYAARTLLGAFAALTLLLSVLGKGTLAGEDYDRIGASVFSLIGKALFLFLVVTTPLLLVGSLASERRGNTLEILLATPEGPRGVVTGKFLARFATALTWAAAALPPLTVAILFGGTSWRALLNLGATLLGTVLETAGWGLVVSAASRKIATAAVLVFALPALHWSLPTAVLGPGTSLAPILLLRATTPLPGLDLAAWDADLQPLAGTGLDGWLRYPGLWHLLVGALVAAVALPVSARLISSERTGADLRLRIPRIRGEGLLRGILTRGNPVAWKESMLLNTAWSRTLFYLVGAALVAGEVAFLVLQGRGAWTGPADAAYLAGCFGALAAMAAVLGAASMAHEKNQGTFDLLRVTRLTPRDIARGKFLGTLIGIATLLLVPLGHVALGMAFGLHPPGSLLFGTVTALLMTANAAIHGVTWGVLARTPGSALAGAAAFAVLSAAGCPTLCFLPFVLAGMRFAKREISTDFFEVIAIPAVLGGSPIWLMEGLLASGGGGASAVRAAPWMGGMAVAWFAITSLYLAYRWLRLPEVLEREMARLSDEGESGPLPATLSPGRDHIADAVRRVRELRERKGKPS